MGKTVDRRITRQKAEMEQIAAAPVSTAKPETTALSYPEANARADHLRAWGRGTMLLFLINGGLAAFGGFEALRSELPLQFIIGAFASALSLILMGFWFRDVHYAAADGLDALAEISRRVRRG